MIEMNNGTEHGALRMAEFFALSARFRQMREPEWQAFHGDPANGELLAAYQRAGRRLRRNALVLLVGLFATSVAVGIALAQG